MFKFDNSRAYGLKKNDRGVSVVFSLTFGQAKLIKSFFTAFSKAGVTLSLNFFELRSVYVKRVVNELIVVGVVLLGISDVFHQNE